MLDYKLFERVTYESNGKRAGYNMREYPQYVDEMKELVKEFNTFTTDLINYFNDHSDEIQLKTVGVTNHWQNSGRYNPYFWNKIIRSTENYDGIAIWLALDANGTHISIGTTGTLESGKDNNFINQVNQNIIQQCTLDVEGFERQLNGKYATYQYKKDELSLEDFFEVLRYLGPIYEHTLSTYQNTINEQEFRRNYKEFVDTLPLQDMGKYARLYTDARNTPFKVYKNSQNSIVVKAFTNNASSMVITANQLSKVIFEGERYLYASYEPILIDRIKNKNYIIEDEIENEDEIEENTYSPIEPSESLVDNTIKNIILYGSPGVGKTHNINKVIRLIEDNVPEKEVFNIIQNNGANNGVDIDDIKDRIKFVTFHQSFGYEDFIEGFRPNNEGNIELVDGVFKVISEEARESRFSLNNIDIDDISDKPSIWKISLGEGGEIKRECFENNCIRLGWDNYGDLDSLDHIKQRELRDFYNLEIGDIVFAFKNQWEIDGIGVVIGNYTFEDNYDNYKHLREVKWIVKDKAINIKNYNNNIRMTLSSLYRLGRISKNDVLEIMQNEDKRQFDNAEPKNYYLIIDEINRGNISKIFGELITLIEEDKRDKIEITLPYSKRSFKVPSNLYIIGTMNSTDKSIALIDIALRRRFTFIKMKPNSTLVPEVARDIFIKLNEAITKKLGEDYQIGHSYFMNINNNNDLEFTLEYKIKPLLEEYFYGDEQGYKEIIAIFDNTKSSIEDNITNE